MAFPAAVTSPFSSMALWAQTARPVAGLSLLLLVSLFSTIKLTKPTEQFASRFAGVMDIGPDHVTVYGQRFSTLRTMLLRHGRVGYVTDQGSENSDEKVLAIQHALAPVLVERGSAHALVVGNITQPTTDLQKFLHQHNLALLKNLGNGVLLLEGTPR